jgi:hypothetical protein
MARIKSAPKRKMAEGVFKDFMIGAQVEWLGVIIGEYF